MLVKGLCAALKGNVGERRMLDVGKSSGRSVQWACAFDGATAGDLLALWRTFRWPFTIRPDKEAFGAAPPTLSVSVLGPGTVTSSRAGLRAHPSVRRLLPPVPGWS
jgi:hypothetical protein